MLTNFGGFPKPMSIIKLFYIKEICWYSIYKLIFYKWLMWNQGEKDEGYEHYLEFLEKREESRRFDVFCVFWERNMVRKEREKCPKMHKTSSKNPIFQFWSNLRCQGLFIALACFLGLSTPCKAAVLMSS